MLIPSLNTLGFPDWSLTRMISFAQAHHVPYLELRALENTTHLLSLPDFSTPEGIAHSQAALQQSGVRLLSLNLGIHLDEDLPAKAEEVIQYASIASALGVPYLRFFSGGNSEERPDLDRLASGARQALALLTPYPLQMLVETHDSLVRSVDILALNERLEGQLNILWDIAHTANHGGETWQETQAQIWPLVRYLHIKDTRRTGGKIQNVLLFEGSLDVPGLLANLARKPEEVIVSLEWEKMWDPSLVSGETAALDFLSKIRQ